MELADGPNTAHYRIAFQEQSEPQQVFSAIWEMEGQVNNGGFSQFILNAESDLIQFAPEALRRIGAHACAQITQEAVEIMGPRPWDKAEADELLAALDEDQSEKLDALSDEFFAYPDDLTELLFQFVERHPEEFGPIPCM
jgi:hypothetical protein